MQVSSRLTETSLVRAWRPRRALGRMGTIWGVNILIGISIARYEKDKPWWFGAHRILQKIASYLTFPLFLIASMSVNRNAASLHAVFGYFITWVGGPGQASLGTWLQMSEDRHRNRRKFKAFTEERRDAFLKVRGLYPKGVFGFCRAFWEVPTDVRDFAHHAPLCLL